MNDRVYYTKPSITEREVELATDAARNGWGDRCYEYISRFEESFQRYIGAKYAIATSSCTGALHMGLAALDIGPGDEVILADCNWIASAAPITYLGAKPVFVDIESDSWCLNPEEVEKAINERTKAIIAVHLYGNLADMDNLQKIGKKYGLPIIEDSAEAIGSTWHGKRAGTIGAFGAFSFHGTKTVTTGEGGMFVTNDAVLYEKTLALSNHGRIPAQKKQFWPDYIGFKYKISNIQAAIGCGQIERIEELTSRKREIFTYYYESLKDIPQIGMNPETENTRNGYWMPTIVFDSSSGITREKFIEAFSKRNIDARVFFYPLSSLPMFENEADERRNPVAYDIPGRAINLPSYHDMTKSQQDRVIAVVRELAHEA